jgi:hypothetical protein
MSHHINDKLHFTNNNAHWASHLLYQINTNPDKYLLPTATEDMKIQLHLQELAMQRACMVMGITKYPELLNELSKEELALFTSSIGDISNGIRNAFSTWDKVRTHVNVEQLTHDIPLLRDADGLLNLALTRITTELKSPQVKETIKAIVVKHKEIVETQRY